MPLPEKRFAKKVLEEGFIKKNRDRLGNVQLFKATEALFLAALADQIQWQNNEEKFTVPVGDAEVVDFNAVSVLRLPYEFKSGNIIGSIRLPHLVLENKKAVTEFTREWYEILYLAHHEFVEEPSSSYRMKDLVSNDEFCFPVDVAGQMVDTRDDYVVGALTLLPSKAILQVIKNGIAVIENYFGSNAHVVAAGTFIKEGKEPYRFNNSDMPQKPVVVYQREY